MNNAPINYASGFRNHYFLITGDHAYLGPQNTLKLAKQLGKLDTHIFLGRTDFSPVDYSQLIDILSESTCNLF